LAPLWLVLCSIAVGTTDQLSEVTPGSMDSSNAIHSMSTFWRPTAATSARSRVEADEVIILVSTNYLGFL